MATPIYTVKVYDFTNAAGGDFSVGSLVVDVVNPKHLCYAEYVNDIGEAFFTVMQSSREAGLLTDIVDRGGHVRIYRDTDLMWSGWLGETDEANNDAIFYAYSYAAGLYTRLTGWEQTFTSQTIDQIFTTLWSRARGISPVTASSRLGWMTTGTLEVPVTTSGGATPYVEVNYVTYYKRILYAFQELVAAAISDTTNRVVWEITPTGVLNLWKNRGTDLTSTLAFHYGDPKLLSYRRQRMPVDRRSVLYAVGTTPRDIALQSTQSSAATITEMGREEESIYLQWVKDQDELDRVTKLRLQRAIRKASEFGLSFAPGKLTPFRATGQSYKLTDGVHVEFHNGATDMSETKLITGQQVLLYRGQEIVRPLLWDRL